MKHIPAVVIGTLLLAYGLPVVAEQTVPGAQSQANPSVQQLHNEIARLRHALRERTVDQKDARDDWQQRYEQKHEELRELQEFQGRYLSHE